MKKIIDSSELMKSKMDGMSKLASIVKRTLGPGGLPILIERVGQALDGSPIGPKITKDGVSVAEECASKDRVQNVVIQAVKAICKKTNVDAGDGTTTAIVLGEAILRDIQEVLANDCTLNPQLVKDSVECATKKVLESLKKQSIPANTMDMVEAIATISANGDTSIGKIIRDAFSHVGAEGVVTVDEGSGHDLTLDVVDGYRFNRGAQSRSDFFNNTNKTHFEAEKAAVILFDGKILNYTDLIPALNILVGINSDGHPTKKMPPVIIVANEFSRDVIQFLLIQKAEMGFQFCAVQGPQTTHIRTAYYDDLAVYTGGTRLGNGSKSLAAIDENDIGLIEKGVIDKYKTTFFAGQGSDECILERVDQLKAQKLLAESPYDVQLINDRIAALTGGIARIGVGGFTEFEIKEKYDRIEDALNAARAAISEGVVPGGGVTLLRISEALDDTVVGESILKKSLKSPFRQILSNIGLSELQIDEIQTNVLKDESVTYDARHLKVVNSLESGILDPVKVTRTALENAVSIAGLLSTAGGAVIFDPDK